MRLYMYMYKEISDRSYILGQFIRALIVSYLTIYMFCSVSWVWSTLFVPPNRKLGFCFFFQLDVKIENVLCQILFLLTLEQPWSSNIFSRGDWRWPFFSMRHSSEFFVYMPRRLASSPIYFRMFTMSPFAVFKKDSGVPFAELDDIDICQASIIKCIWV